MSAIILKLKCITNLHVGNGEVNYTIIDNEVEKDPVTGYPIINASGGGTISSYQRFLLIPLSNLFLAITGNEISQICK